MKKFLLIGLAALSLGGMTACSPEKEYEMNIIEIVEDYAGNHLAYCEPAKMFKMKHYVDIPELESYEGVETFVAKQGKEKTEFVLKDGKKVNDGKYKFYSWGE